MSTLLSVELGVLGPLQVRQDGAPVSIPGAKPRAILTMLGLHCGSVVSADTLVGLLWGEDPPRTAVKALQTHISSLRRTLGDGFVLTEGAGWTLAGTEVDASRYKSAARLGRDAATAGDTSQAVAGFEQALTLWRGIPELPDGQRGLSEKTRWIEGHAALVEDRADALLATGRAAEIIGDLEAAVAEAPLRERRWGQLMLALYRAGRQGEALGAYQRARSLLADELGVDPGPELRRLEAAIVAQDASLDIVVAQHLPSVTRALTFLLTDIEGSTAAWEADADAMAVALARHDELVEQVVTSRGGRLIKTRGEGDATFSVFERPSAAAAAALELQDAISHEPWALREPMRIRVALHTGEVELRDGDYFGRAVNRVARLRSLAGGGQILCSGATAELVIDSLSDDVVLTDLGMRQLRNLTRPEHVFELGLETAEDGPQPQTIDAPMERPGLPAVLIGHGPFVGRGDELERLLSAWQTALAGGLRTVLIAGEPGVGKTRLAGEWSQRAYEQGAAVLYGRCDEDLGAPYQPFAEALRSLVPCVGAGRLRGLRGVEALLPLVPGLTDVLPDLATPASADPDTERYALFDAVVALLQIASVGAPVVLILDDLHWAAKPTLLLLRHLLRFGDHARVQIVGTYRSTDLDRSHPLAAMLADLHRDGTANRLNLSGLDEDDVTAYVAEAGYDDEELAHALASVTGGNPFFLIEALRHVDESGGVWDQSTLPQGVREAVSRRLSRLPIETNKALAAAAVVGSRFALELVERVVGTDLIDAFDESCQAGIVIEEPGGNYRFNHAIVRQSLLAELASVRRMRLHQRIATTLEAQPGADDELLAELAHHYFECAWAGNAAKAVFYCRRAGDQAMARLAYEGAADLYDHALHALEEIDDELPDRDDQAAELLVARCEALLAAGDVASAAGAVSQLQEATIDSARLAAWATCFDGQLSMLIHPERLDQVEAALGAAAEKLAGLDDAAGEAKAHTVRAACLARLGRIADCEIALDDALTAARRAREHRRVNAVLAGAPLAALWGPNPVPRAGGRCLDVVRLLRITTDSPAVEATSTRCQAVLEAFRGRAAAARRMIDSARRTVTELGLRHAFLEVEQFAGIVELVLDDPAEAEPHLRQAYNGFRRMGLDADTAETAALLGRACLALNRDAEADELCRESERLAGHALKPSIAWRTLRAQLLSRGNEHDDARRFAEAAISLAERTDLLVDHGDACLALARVLGSAGDGAGARAAAERAVGLYERKGAGALAEKARGILGADRPTAPAPPEPPPQVEPDNACVRAIRKLEAAFDREAWSEIEKMYAPDVFVESRRKALGFTRNDLPSGDWPSKARRLREIGGMRHRTLIIAVRGERLALTRVKISTEDESPGSPHDEVLQLCGVDEEGRIALQIWFDVEDIDAAIAELDATHARFDEVHRPAPLENAATRVNDQMGKLFASSRWDEIGALFADDLCVVDRRQGLRRESSDRTTEVANLRAFADLGIVNISATKLAVRGNRLCLIHVTLHGRDEFGTDFLVITEVDAVGLIVTMIALDPYDVDAAYEELEARYLAGEAAPYRHVWQIGMDTLGELNRHEPGRMISGLVYTDHRRVPFAPGDFGRAVEELWALVPDARYRTTEVYALDAHGTVVKFVIEGTDVHGNELQWPRVLLRSVGRDETRLEVYEEDDVDAALARFEELRPQARRLENAASQAAERYSAHFAARDWDALAKVLADDISIDDRRRVVNAGIRHGRDAEIANLRATVDAGFMDITSVVIAARGERLILARASGRGRGSEEFLSDAWGVLEINSHNQIAAIVVFDLDDFESALAELDARYLAGEAAAHAHTWSVIVDSYAAQSRHELPAMTPDCVTVDHRRAKAFAPGEMTEYIRAGWDLDQTIRTYVQVVHRLSDLGAVCTYAGHGVSHEGFDAEWREIAVTTVEGDMVNRCELFDETDIDAALARFDQLSRPAPRLENAASQVYEHFWTCFAARDWVAMAEILADDSSTDDRRRVVNAGIRRGRGAVIADMRAVAEVGTADNITSTVLATRGERLTLNRIHSWALQTELLNVVELNADERTIASVVVFDIEDIDAAFEELDARYLTGEAAACSRTWSVITGSYAAFNRHEVPATEDWVTIDHRRGTPFEPSNMTPSIRTIWDLTPDLSIHIEAVHRLNNSGAVITHQGHGSSQEGFDAEWRAIDLLMVDGDLINRCEVFDETDLDAALAKFDQLSRPTPRLENAASRVAGRVWACFAAGDWDSLAELFADEISTDDRRRVVNAGVFRGRDAQISNMRALTEFAANITSAVIATRGERLALNRISSSNSEDFDAELLSIIEVGSDNRAVAGVQFDPDDFDAAIAELDARYLAEEGAAHARTWSVIVGMYASFNRHELPATAPEWVTVDRRPGATFEFRDATAFFRATWNLTPHASIYAEAVHQLTSLGAVVTHVVSGTSQDGFDAEWRQISIFTVEGDLISRCELFDEADLDAALARFEQLSQPAPRLENAASQVCERYLAHYAARDWDGMADILAADFSSDDRRRVVGAGIRHGRDAQIANMRAISNLAIANVTSANVATRGERLVLQRVRFSDGDRGTDPFLTERLGVGEIDADERIVAFVSFDLENFEAAMAELDARYLAGEAATQSHAWSLVVRAFAAINRHELPELTPDCVNIDHRRGAAFAPGDMTAFVHDLFEHAPDINVYVEAVHRLSDLGVVVTQRAHGTSQEGFEAEWREIGIFMFEGDLLSRCELFDDADLDAALAKFEELSRPAPRLENAASRIIERILTSVTDGDLTAPADTFATSYCLDDRRRIVNSGTRQGRNTAIEDLRIAADVGFTEKLTVVATRGDRLALTRGRWSGRDQGAEAFHLDVFQLTVIDTDERVTAVIVFDLDDFDAAIAELDARYLTGEAAAHAHTWSVIAKACAALNQRELFPTTPDWVNIDHRQGIAFEPGDLTAYIRSAWDLLSDGGVYVETAHRLSDLGAVVIWTGHAASQVGSRVEFRGVNVLTVRDDLISRCEIFDEADLDAALARFDQLSRPTPRLENAATRTVEQFFAQFGARDWDAMAELLADDVSSDDRRGVVNAGIRHGRDPEMANWRATDDIWTISVRSTVATRGEHLTLIRFVFTSKDGPPEAFSVAALAVVEINDDNRIAEIVVIEPDDIDAAVAELDARYLAGEAAAHADTWSVISHAYAALNRRELPATTRDRTSIDHRRFGTIEANALTPNLRAWWDLTSEARIDIETVHRLTNLGAVVTHIHHATWNEGAEIESREIVILTVEGDLLSRCEIFDEARVDTALARFDELHPRAPRLENAASRVGERYLAHYAAGDWDGMAEILADDFSSEDRRRVVGAGVRHGRDAEIVDMRAIADLGLANVTSTAIATRGGCLVLSRVRFSDRDHGPETVLTEVLIIVEINAVERIVATVTFDLDEIDAAFGELDARYLAGEAADHAPTWSAIAGVYAAFNRRELPAPDYVAIDHRRATLFTSSDLAASIRDSLDLTPDLSIHIEAVHQLNNFGALLTNTSYGTSQEGFDAEWRMIQLLTVEGDRINRLELFDETDLDAALARFEELQPQAPRLKNAAGRIVERYQACFSTHDWTALAGLLADDIVADDRRRVVNAGVRRGRDVYIADMRAAVEVGAETTSASVVATRGERLALAHARAFNRGSPPGEVGAEWLGIAEIDADERIVAIVVFDLDDIDAAYEELDARYLAGEAAAHAHTWSVIAQERATFNRHELTAVDYITVDHRPLPIIEAFSQAALRVWDVTPDFGIHIEAVHRLSGFGAVATYQANGTSPEGFDGEWRMILLVTVEGDRINRCEVFDESDLDAALARFEELHPPAPRLENAASQIIERYLAHFAARDWAAFAELLADDIIADDRRRVVNAGIRRGRDIHIADNRVVVEVSAPTLSSNVIATRSERLALAHVRIVNRGMSGEVGAEVLGIAEIDADERIVALVTFDPDDIDAAYEELEARYLAGEAAAHAHTWSVIAETFAGLNRHEPPQTTPDWVEVDRRRITATAPGDLIASLRASWDLIPDFAVRIETVHRLTDLGAVITETARGISQDGFAAEWRDIVVQTVEGNLTNRCEIFDEADLDVSLARFEELSRPALRLENAASQVSERFWSYYTARDWDAMAAMLGDNFSSDDRRRVVNAGVQHGRDNQIADMRALAEVEANVTVAAVATRGERLVLIRVCSSNRDLRHGEFGVEMLAIAEIDGDNRIAATVLFDADDIDAAFDELDARYLAGEAADIAHTWSVVSDAYAAFNRHELPAEDLVTVDRRRATPFESSTMTETLRSIWDLTPDLNIRIEAVCRLSSCGAVVTHVQHGTSTEGFDAEWRSIELMTVDGDRINYCEIFDEADLDAALARFEELQTQARRPRNAASQLIERFQTYFAARNWAAIADISAEEIFTDDRRSVVSSGILRGRDVDLANIRATAELGATGLTSTVIATRGERIALARLGLSGRDQRPEAFRSEMLGIVEIDAGNRFAARILFDLNDFDAAIAELDARYLAGETAAHANTWSVIAAAHAGFNRQELPATTPDPVYIDHRPLVSIEGADLAASLRAVWDITPASSVYIEAVHRLDKLGAVATQVLKGTSQEGLDAEWRMIDIFTVEGNLYSRVEVFDETDLDAALARFEELHPQGPRLDSAATQVDQRFWTYFEARDWDAMARLLAAEIASDDRRRVVNTGVLHGRDVQIANLRALAGLGVANITSTSIATRGERLALTRVSSSNRDLRHGEFRLDGLNIIEIDADNRVAAGVLFDLDDIDAAFEELDARYLAGEAAVHSHTWSVIARECAAFNRHELPTADWVTIDHRRPIDSIDSSDLHANIRATWDLMPDISIHIEAAHRLSGFGAVVTYAAHGTSSKGFDADWRMIQLLTVEGDLINRCEIFDEADLDAALARFEELHHQASHPENAASQVVERFWKYFAARDWDAMAETIADDFWTHDRRRVVNAGVLRGRAVHITNMRAVAEVGFGGLTSTAIATRGHRSALIRIRSSMRGAPPGEVTAEMLSIVEIDADNRLTAAVLFDSDDTDAAFEELEARYLVGEAAAHAQTWSVIARTYAAFNRHEFPSTTRDSVYIDHRPLLTNDASDLAANIRASWDLMDVSIYIAESVHRLSELGAVVTQTLKGTSKEGLDVEYRMIDIFTVEGDLLSRCEVFDEADLDAALARFEELHPPTRRLENAASQVEQRFLTYFAARDWDAYAEILSDDVRVDDRRHVVNAGVRRGRDAEIASMRAIADVGVTHFTSTVIAIRGGRLALGSYSVFDGWGGSTVLSVSEINAENQIVARVAFDSDDVDAAFEELDARYLAGEAAAHAHIWTAVTQVQAAYNRHEFPPTTTDCVNIDHRRGRAFAPGDAIPYIRATYDVAPNVKGHIEAVHRLGNLGVVITEMVTGTSQEGFSFEWREIALFAFEGDMVSRFEMFDEADLDTALARFDELDRPPLLENAATRTWARQADSFNRRDMDSFFALMTADGRFEDRRKGLRVVTEGPARRKAVQAVFEEAPSSWRMQAEPIAIRGSRLELTRECYFDTDEADRPVTVEFLHVVEVSHSGLAQDIVSFDPNDIDAAFDELDARYLAGEAAPHAHTWSVIARECAAFNRHELNELTAADYITIDHRPLAIIDAADPQAAMRAIWDVTPDLSIRIETVHRLGSLGALATYKAHGTSPEGSGGEWRMIFLLTVEGDRINRCEIFDETDVDAALARFEELQPQTPRLENAAGRIVERCLACFSARDWATMAELLADDIVVDDRRRVVNAGVRRGRDVYIADNRAAVEVGAETTSASVVATRGERLALAHVRAFNRGSPPSEVGAEWLGIAEIDADERIVAIVVFDLDDIDAAYEELDASYLAGEAAAHARTWSVIAGTFAGLNRRELPPTTPDWVEVDRRRIIASAPGDLIASLSAMWELLPDFAVRIETVDRLTDLAAVVTYAAQGTSQDGVDAEWRDIVVLSVEGDRINRCELFDETDRDAALARFEELGRPARRLENKASRAGDRFFAYFRTRNWAAIAEILTDDSFVDDRRRVVNAGFWDGRDVVIANMRALEEGGANITSTVVATRGQLLALTHICSANRDQRQGEFGVEMLGIAEIDTDERIAAHVLFEVDDIDAAFAELDARYLAGEAGAHSHAWSVNSGLYAGFNRHELPATTPDWIYIDHRPLVTIEANDLPASMRAIWDLAPDINIYTEAVHRLSDLGAVVTAAVYGSSQEGFDAEWRMIDLFTVEGDLISRCEIFDEADLDAALARFEELHPPTRRLENAASRADDRFFAYFRARNWAALAEILADESFIEDRRPVVNAGRWDGCDVMITNMQALAEGAADVTSVIATRGERLALSRIRSSNRDPRQGEFDVEMLNIVEIDTEGRIAAHVEYDPDDIDAAFAELDARYLAGEAVGHARTWSAVMRAYTELNRGELPTTTPDFEDIDHRRAAAMAPGELIEYLRAALNQTPELSIYIEAVHLLSDRGAIVIHAAHGTSREGFDAEWREVSLVTAGGDTLNRCELFDETDLDAALARFDELDRQAS